MSDEILLFFALIAGVILLVVVIVAYRDSILSNKIKSIEIAIERLYREIHKIEGNLKNTNQTELESLKNSLKMDSEKALMEVQDLKVELDMQHMKIGRLEEKVGEFLAVPNSSALDAARVISLHNMGYSVEEIARELRASANEVALALKLNNLEPRRSF